MGDMKQLNNIALSQGGCFTAKQAESCGYANKNHYYHVKQGNWLKEGRGIYRLPTIPENETSYYWPLLLWSRNRDDELEAVFSYETALSFYELSDNNPAKVSVTVPKSFRRSSETPKGLKLHKGDLSKKDIKTYQGLPVTTPLKTLVDIYESKIFSEELLEQAVKEALQKGLVRKKELKENYELARYAL